MRTKLKVYFTSAHDVNGFARSCVCLCVCSKSAFMYWHRQYNMEWDFIVQCERDEKPKNATVRVARKIAQTTTYTHSHTPRDYILYYIYEVRGDPICTSPNRRHQKKPTFATAVVYLHSAPPSPYLCTSTGSSPLHDGGAPSASSDRKAAYFSGTRARAQGNNVNIAKNDELI